MNKFEKQLEKWNNGVLRGAQAKLAKCLQVTTATVALWATGKRHPSKGYIAQMARLFYLDEHSVERLFNTRETFPPIYEYPTSGNMLRETGTVAFPATRSQEETISLPIFSSLPPAYPKFLSKDTLGWWTLPVSWAPKARFLFLLPGKNDPERLLFVEPRSTWQKGKMMLGRQDRTYKLFRVEQQGAHLVLYPEQRPCIPAERVQPIGVVTRYFGRLKITP